MPEFNVCGLTIATFFGFAAVCSGHWVLQLRVFGKIGFPALCSNPLVFQLCVQSHWFSSCVFGPLGFQLRVFGPWVFQLCVHTLWFSSCVFRPSGFPAVCSGPSARHVMYMMHCLLQASLNVQRIVDTQNRIFLCMQGHAIAFRSSCLLLGRLVECLATPG